MPRANPVDKALRGQSMALQNHPTYLDWVEKTREARSYFSDVKSRFAVRDANYDEMFELRHGLLQPKIPPSHSEIVQNVTSKEANELLARLVAILSARYPDWVFHADNVTDTAGLRAANLGNFSRSLFLGIEDRIGLPVIRVLNDQQLGYGGGILKVLDRMDRWAELPPKSSSESDKAYRERLRAWKARNIPFDFVVPEYNTVYYDNTVDGMVRVAEAKRASVYDLASQFGGTYNDNQKRLIIPVELPAIGEDGVPTGEVDTLDVSFKAAREVEYLEYWKRGDWVVYVIQDLPVRMDYLPEDRELPYFLALGEVTSSPDPGRMGLPVLYNAEEEFLQKMTLRAMENAFLYKHGFARLKHRLPSDATGASEPDLPDQEEEEEQIGEVLETKGDEDWEYLLPANVSMLFADAKQDVNKAIQDTAMADVLTGRLPPAGTTGYLMSQVAEAAVSKYVPLLAQTARAIRSATLYIMDTVDEDFSSEVAVRPQIEESTTATFFVYKPGDSKYNRNLEVRIEAPLPSDQIAKTQYYALGHKAGYVSQETVQREGYKVKNIELENEKMLLEQFDQMYRPIAMMKALQRRGQMDEFMEAARAGLLPPGLAQLALLFAQGPDGAQPTANPNQIIAPEPGLGEPGVPTTGASSNAEPTYGLQGRAPGAERRPGGPRAPANPEMPLGVGGGEI